MAEAGPTDDEDPDGAGGADVDGVGESAVRVPVRRVPVPPVPLAVRLADDHGPRRQCSPLATLESPVLGEVDPAGRIQMAGTNWSLDWWLGAEDRWHHPSMEGARSSTALDGSPVREHRLRVPGGEVGQRVGAAVVGAGSSSGPGVVVEVGNDSAVPVALALVVSPWRLDERGRVGSVCMAEDGPHGCVITIDGFPALLMDRSPARVVVGSTGEVARALAASQDEEPVAGREYRAGSDGDLEVALVMPLAHTATARFLLLPPPESSRARRRAPSGAGTVSVPFSAPALESVAAGWATHAGTDPRIVAPYEAWSELVASSATLLRVAGPAEVTRALDPDAPRASGPPDGARLGAVCEALAGLDADDVNNAVAGALVTAQRFSGCVEPADGSDATAALCWSAGAVLLGGSGAELSDDFVGPAAKAVRWIGKQHRRGRNVGIAGVGTWRCAASLRLLAAGLAAVGQPGVAQDALALSADLDSVGSGEAGRGVAPPAVATASTFEWARSERDAAHDGSSWHLERLAERVPPRRDTAVADAVGAPSTLGWDAAELAETRSTLLEVFVRDAAGGPEILPVWPDVWAGNSMEAHGIRTAWGRVSFGLRWHGPRAAVLWDVVPAVGGTEGMVAPAVRVPGLDPDFSGDSWTGEALLDPARDASGGGVVGVDRDDAPGGSPSAGPVSEGESFS